MTSDRNKKTEEPETDVVVIGGGEVEIETGMHLAEKGREVTVLEMG